MVQGATIADALEAGERDCLYRLKALPQNVQNRKETISYRGPKVHAAVQLFNGFADALEAVGWDCLYRLKVPQTPEKLRQSWAHDRSRTV